MIVEVLTGFADLPGSEQHTVEGFDRSDQFGVGARACLVHSIVAFALPATLLSSVVLTPVPSLTPLGHDLSQNDSSQSDNGDQDWYPYGDLRTHGCTIAIRGHIAPSASAAGN